MRMRSRRFNPVPWIPSKSPFIRNTCEKEIVARAIHDQSSRREGRFLPVDCTGISSDLFESELFGHAKGAFTEALNHLLSPTLSAPGSAREETHLFPATEGLGRVDAARPRRRPSCLATLGAASTA